MAEGRKYGLEELSPVKHRMQASGFDHLGRWVMLNTETREGRTSCSCGWVAESTNFKIGGEQQREHMNYMRRLEDAAAQAGFIPEGWRR